MKVFFVGMHNKPGMKPLDSKTMTGKVIDVIGENINCDWRKTNLCDISYFPKDNALINKMATEWHIKHNPENGDIIVLLGTWVQKHFLTMSRGYKIIKIGHPAGVFGSKNKAEYISKAIRSILTPPR